MSESGGQTDAKDGLPRSISLPVERGGEVKREIDQDADKGRNAFTAVLADVIDKRLWRWAYLRHPTYVNLKKAVSLARGDHTYPPEEEPNGCWPRTRWFVRWHIVNRKWFEGAILFFIILSCVFIGMRSPARPESHWTNQCAIVTEPVFSSVFILEMILKFVGLGFFRKTPSREEDPGHPIAYYSLADGYWRSAWNYLDFAIVVASFVSLFGGPRLFYLRLIRVFRPLRAIAYFAHLRSIVDTMAAACAAVVNIILFMSALYLVFGVGGTQLFDGVFHQRCYNATSGALVDPDGRICGMQDAGDETLYTCPTGLECRSNAPNPNFGLQSFDTFYNSLFNVFQAVQGEGCFDVIYDLQDGYFYGSWLYLLLIFVFITIMSMNILMAAIEDAYKQNKEQDDAWSTRLACKGVSARQEYVETVRGCIAWLRERIDNLHDEHNSAFLERFPHANDAELPIQPDAYEKEFDSLAKRFEKTQERIRELDRLTKRKKLPVKLYRLASDDSVRSIDDDQGVDSGESSSEDESRSARSSSQVAQIDKHGRYISEVFIRMKSRGASARNIFDRPRTKLRSSSVELETKETASSSVENKEPEPVAMRSFGGQERSWGPSKRKKPEGLEAKSPWNRDGDSGLMIDSKSSADEPSQAPRRHFDLKQLSLGRDPSEGKDGGDSKSETAPEMTRSPTLAKKLVFLARAFSGAEAKDGIECDMSERVRKYLIRTEEMARYAFKAMQTFERESALACKHMELFVLAISRVRQEQRRLEDYLYGKPHWMRKIARAVQHWTFEAAAMAVVALNVGFLASDRAGISNDEYNVIVVVNRVCFFCYALECVLRAIATGWPVYISKPWNQFDLLIVGLSAVQEIVDLADGDTRASQWVSAFRVMRGFRLARFLTHIRSLRVVSGVVASAIMDAMYIIIIMVVVLFIFSVMGVQLFGSKFGKLGDETRFSFEDTYQSFLVVFMSVTGDSWPDASAEAMHVTGNDAAPLFFCMLLVFGDFIVMNLFIAVLLQGFDEDDDKMNMTFEDLTDIARTNRHRAPQAIVAELDQYLTEQREEQAKARVRRRKRMFEISARVEDPSPYSTAPEWVRRAQKRVYDDIVTTTWFSYMMLAIIVADSILMGLRVSHRKRSDVDIGTVRILQMTLLPFYTIEIALKILAFGPSKYFTGWYNVLDCFLAIVGYVSLSHLGDNSTVHFLYSLRPLRLLGHSPPSRIILHSIFQATSQLTSAALMLVTLIFAFALMFLAVFKGAQRACNDASILSEADCTGSFTDPDTGLATVRVWENIHFVRNFDNIGNSMLVLFQVSTLTTWNEVMYACIDSVGEGQAMRRNAAPGWGLVFFVFVMLSAFLATNLFVAVLVKRFEHQKNKNDGSAFITADERQWVKSRRYMLKLLRLPRGHRRVPNNPMRRAAYWVVGAPTDKDTWFETFIFGCILLNAVFLCLRWYGQPGEVTDMLFVTNIVFTSIFAAEMVLKIVAWTPRVYFHDSWNRFDSAIVIVSCAGIAVRGLDRVALVFRTLRVLRVFMLIRKMRLLSQFSQVFFLSIPATTRVIFLIFVVVYIFALNATSQFQDVAFWDDGLSIHANFRDLPRSMLTLFRVLVGDAWEEIMYGCMITPETGVCSYGEGNCGVWWASLYFVFYVLFVQVMLVSLLLAVQIEAFQNFLEQDDIYNTLSAWRDLWIERDPKGYGYLPAAHVIEIIEQAPRPYGFGAKPGERVGKRAMLARLRDFGFALRKKPVLLRRMKKLRGFSMPRRWRKSQREDERNKGMDTVRSMGAKRNIKNMFGISPPRGSGVGGQSGRSARDGDKATVDAWVVQYDDVLDTLLSMRYNVSSEEVLENWALLHATAATNDEAIESERGDGRVAKLYAWYCVDIVQRAWYWKKTREQYQKGGRGPSASMAPRAAAQSSQRSAGSHSSRRGSVSDAHAMDVLHRARQTLASYERRRGSSSLKRALRNSQRDVRHARPAQPVQPDLRPIPNYATAAQRGDEKSEGSSGDSSGAESSGGDGSSSSGTDGNGECLPPTDPVEN